MMRHLHAVAAARGADRIHLTVYRTNPIAVDLYAALGYVLEPLDDDRLLGILRLEPAARERTLALQPS